MVLGVLGGRVRCRIFWKRIFFSLYAPFLFFYAFSFKRARGLSFRRFFGETAVVRAVSLFWRDRADEAQKYGF